MPTPPSPSSQLGESPSLVDQMNPACFDPRQPEDNIDAEPHWLPLTLDDMATHHPGLEHLVSPTYHFIDGGCGYLNDKHPEYGISFAGIMTQEQGEYICAAVNQFSSLKATANAHAGLVAALDAAQNILEVIGKDMLPRDRWALLSKASKSVTAALANLNR